MRISCKEKKMQRSRKDLERCLTLFSSNKSKYVFVLSLAFGIRLLPELLSGVYPVGFDVSAGYIPSILALPNSEPLKLFGWAYSPLAIYLLWSIYASLRIDPNLLMKIAGPVFYGLFSVSFCFLLSRGLSWSNKKVVLVSLLFLLQPAILRTGWDQLREELGFVFMFSMLAITRCELLSGAKAKPLLVSFLAVLIVFSHQLVAILLFVVVLWQMAAAVIRKHSSFLTAAFIFLPAALVFAWQLWAQFVSGGFSPFFAPLSLPTGTGNFMFTNYFLNDPRFVGADYWKVLGYVGCLLLYTVVPLILPAKKGFFKDGVFMPWTIWLAVASLSIVIYPWYAVAHFSWWVLLLPIPLTVYAGNYLGLKLDENRRNVVIVFSLLSIVAVGYATSVIPLGYPYAYYYMPSGLVETSLDFAHIKDTPDVENALRWVNNNLQNTTVIVPEKMQGQAYTYLMSDIKIRVAPPFLNFSTVLGMIQTDEKTIYAVCFVDDVGEYREAETLKMFGEIVVLKIRLMA
jgi:hypothetical protein